MPQSTTVKNPTSGHIDGQQPAEYKIHSNLTSSHQLLQALERRFTKGSYTVEMRHNIYTVRVDSSKAPPELSRLQTSKHHL
ncbi:hypothetical protein CORC01_06758 [Colletotrichum orchidophilum]|uniref:Uncharacterized protein n=1 Tax=Colletotrichum orchidophilum TaxID=1209926 RepID=A0A1G4B995_9PEZI|nr:uncharacterized protein CORC01_06758 [Colletotrichum orchidophilum]OHE97895.1 hypothetical protein CORC01_06758 [Colletotrichum orchidophilum]